LAVTAIRLPRLGWHLQPEPPSFATGGEAVGGRQPAGRRVEAGWGAAGIRCGWWLALTVLLCALAALVSAAASWERFRSETGRFAVELPTSPKLTHTRQGSLVGTIESAEYRVEAGLLELRVEHHDVPALAAFFVSDRGLLERAQDDLVAGEEALELSASESQVDDRLVREVHYRVLAEGGRDGRARFQLVGGRLYVQAALFPRDRAEDPALERFFASFEVWER
jgi:hypothetical protein